MTKSKFIECACHAEGMGIDYDEEDALYYFSYWSQGFSNKSLSIKDRIRYCWHVLRKGKAFEDEIVLDSAKVNELCSWILDNETDKNTK